jgi:hypothetical protein
MDSSSDGREIYQTPADPLAVSSLGGASAVPPERYIDGIGYVSAPQP